MTRNQVILAIVLSIGANLLTWMFLQPTLTWLRKQTFDRLFVGARIEAFFYRKVARRDTSLTFFTFMGVFSLVSTIVFVSSVLRNPTDRRFAVALAVAVFYNLTVFVINGSILMLAENAIRRYEYLKALARPYIDEANIIRLDEQFATIIMKAQYDVILDFLRTRIAEAKKPT